MQHHGDALGFAAIHFTRMVLVNWLGSVRRAFIERVGGRSGRAFDMVAAPLAVVAPRATKIRRWQWRIKQKRERENDATLPTPDLRILTLR
jgi:hypothetical protein